MYGPDTEVDGGGTSEAEETERTKGQSWKCDPGVLGIAIRQRAAAERRREELQGLSLHRVLGDDRSRGALWQHEKSLLEIVQV